MIFINYRRSDTKHLARALAEMLRQRFGPDNVFLDEASIGGGAEWAKALEEALAQASVVLSLVGPNWLKCADEVGRRRLDDSGDWVRKELVAAKDCKEVIPILVGGIIEFPEEEGLPDELKWLRKLQYKTINDNNWYSDVQALIDILAGSPAMRTKPFAVPLPVSLPHKTKKQELTKNQVISEIRMMEGWEPVRTEYPPREELRKIYVFSGFRRAMSFMSFVAPKLAVTGHHPRWENQYRTVTVYFSTWDVGSQITQHDLAAARSMDSWLSEFESSSHSAI